MKALATSRSVLLGVTFLVLGPVSCSDSSGKTRKIRKVHGVAKVIDLENNYVSMVVSDDKGNERELRGTVKEDTEVWINGRSHRLEDVRPGDKVVVYGYKEGKGEDQKLVATKVEVSRPRESDWQSTKRPATQVQAQPVVPAAPVKASGAQSTASARTAQPSPGRQAVRRNQAEDMIYATIRIKMEEFIEKRAALLKAGRDPSDTQIRELEGQIMKARQLLLDAGEIVEDVEPPIVETVPKTP